MWEKNIGQRLALIAVVIAAGLFLLVNYDPDEGRFGINLRPGLDIAGGVSMIFEIQEEQGQTDPFLAEEMKNLLQKRVDPQGVYGLIWNVLGRNRIQVQMPLPPPENEGLKNAYLEAEKVIVAGIVQRDDVESALRLPAAERDTELAKLAGGVDGRLELLKTAAAAWDAWETAKQATIDPTASQPVTPEDLLIRRRDTEEAFEDAIEAVLDTSFPMGRFRLARDMEQDDRKRLRKEALEALKNTYPNMAAQIDAAIAAWDKWRGKRVYLESAADLRRLLSGTGKLEFRILAEPDSENVTKYEGYRQRLAEDDITPRAEDAERWFKIDNPPAFFNVDSLSSLANADPRFYEQRGMVVGKRGEDWYALAKRAPEHGLLVSNERKWELKGAFQSRDQQGRRCAAFRLDPVGGKLFGRLTEANVNKQLCIFIDDVAYSSANIVTRITTDGQITGDFSAEKLRYLIQTMQAGVLPAKLKDTPLSEITIGSSLGETNLTSAFRAGVAGVIAVGLVMIAYYWVSGAIANAALVLNILLVLAAMAMLGARMTLAGIAGVILTIGMTVDANVLIFERMREEKQRGSSLRMIIKNGYEKAFSTIIDANITTLLTCVIIYKVGSEEIKGFGLTLGWGIVTSLFTSLFVTRTLFTLLVKRHWIKDIGMLKLIGVPDIDWYGKRKRFGIASLIIIVGGLLMLYERGIDAFDVEFRGGVSAEIELKKNTSKAYDDRVIEAELQRVAARITADAAKLANATVEVVGGDATRFRVRAADVPAARLAALITEPLEAQNLLKRGGVDDSSEPGALLLTSAVEPDDEDQTTTTTTTAEQLQAAIRALASKDGKDIEKANTNIVLIGDEEDRGRFWNITTTETNKRLVQSALVEAFGDDLVVQPRVSYVFKTDDDGRPFPITERRLTRVVTGLPDAADASVSNYRGGAALFFDQLNPPQAVEVLRDRLANMRLQPDFQDLPYRRFDVLGVQKVGVDGEGRDVYNGVVIVVVDDQLKYSTRNSELWATEFADDEITLASAMFDTEQSLRKVTQFKPQIADQSKTQAILALLLSWIMIIAYLWIRFGSPRYGMAGVAALVHDVLIALAFVGISGWIGATAIGQLTLINDFKIDMTIVAAFLTIIGYSINDTIVVFDRIRETRGRLGAVTPDVINRSINQCLARTILTSATTLVVLVVMFTFGGTSIRGFNYCMIIGVLTGTYSSIAVAAPLLMFGAQKRHRAGAIRPATA